MTSDPYYRALDKYQRAVETERTARNALRLAERFATEAAIALNEAHLELCDLYNKRGDE